MAAYTILTIKTPYSPARTPETTDPFQVIVQNECYQNVANLGAMSHAHARMIAGSVALLLPKLDPSGTVVLDISINGRAPDRMSQTAA